MIDTGATHSFILCAFAYNLKFRPKALEKTLVVKTPSKRLLEAHCLYKDYRIRTSGIEVCVNLIPLDFVRFDVILGMNWLEKYRAIIDCENKIVTLRSPK